MLADFIAKTLTPQISPMVYITMFVSVFIGFCFLTGVFVDTGESVLYSSGVLIHTNVWGGILFTTASAALAGMLLNKDSWVKVGGMAGFMAWAFACISVLMAGHAYIFVTVSLFHLLFHGYVYLASQWGLLRRIPIEVKHHHHPD